MALGVLRGVTALFRGLGGGGMGATCMVYSDDTPALIKAFALASTAIFGARVQVCNGVDDEVEINAAMGAIVAIGGKVLLSEGTFHIADPIVVPANSIMLEGMGEGTVIDGDLLATTEHAIVISGVTGCFIRCLSIQTEDGSGDTCHCIFIEDGANGTHVEDVHIVDSAANGIHIEGTSMTGISLAHCHIVDADGNGVYVDTDGVHVVGRLTIKDCTIQSCGISGINLAATDGGYGYCLIEGNMIVTAVGNGMTLYDLNDSEIIDNVVYTCGGHGIFVDDSEYVQVRGNQVENNTDEGIWLVDVPNSMIADNICSDNGGAGDHAGIKVNPNSINCLITGNHCCGNSYYGIFNYAPNNEIIGNYVHENARHGIVMQGHECTCSGNHVWDNSQETEATYHGIYLTNDAVEPLIVGNYCSSPGDTQEDGIHVTGCNTYGSIVGNWCSNGMGSGIYLSAGYYYLVNGNYCYDNDDYGIELLNSVEAHVKDNVLIGNDTGQFLDGGFDTATPEIWAPFAFENAIEGYRPVKEMLNDADTPAYCTLQIPLDFQELVTVSAVVIPEASGNLVWLAATSFGKICADQQEDAHTDTVAQNTVAVTDDEMECLDLADAFTALDIGDNVGVQVSRIGTDQDDTVAGTVNAVGVRLRYV